VLAIASKNDPANIHWDGGILDEDDFVYSHISWEPKIGAFKKMQTELNLKIKDFVFIDDRSDEREFVKTTYPQITTLDALADRSWEMMTLWESMLDENGAMDRTQLYQERAARNQFIGDQSTEEPNEEEMFGSLGLTISVKPADDKNIQRASELINRTNQFNMRASRTSLPEMMTRLNSDAYIILATSMADKFGDMGIISILVGHETSTEIEIVDFVLSCRVFGYSAERVILNTLKAFAQKAGKPIRGEYIETLYNSPCKNVYPENEFTTDGNLWTFNLLDAPLITPTWFNVSEA
jgi:FkbH-like protein